MLLVIMLYFFDYLPTHLSSSNAPLNETDLFCFVLGHQQVRWMRNLIVDDSIFSRLSFPFH